MGRDILSLIRKKGHGILHAGLGVIILFLFESRIWKFRNTTSEIQHFIPHDGYVKRLS